LECVTIPQLQLYVTMSRSIPMNTSAAALRRERKSRTAAAAFVVGGSGTPPNFLPTSGKDHITKEGFEAEPKLPTTRGTSELAPPTTILQLRGKTAARQEKPEDFRHADMELDWVVVCQFRLYSFDKKAPAMACLNETTAQFPTFKVFLLHWDMIIGCFRVAGTAKGDSATIFNYINERHIVGVSPGSQRPLTVIKPQFPEYEDASDDDE